MTFELSFTENIFYWIFLGYLTGIIFQLTFKNISIKFPYIIIGILGSIAGGLLSLNIYGNFSYLNISSTLISITISLLTIIFYHLGIHSKLFNKLYSNVFNKNKKYYFSVYSSNVQKISSEKEINILLSKITYPASKSDIISLAEKEFKNEASISKLVLIPNHIYKNKAQIQKEISKI